MNPRFEEKRTDRHVDTIKETIYWERIGCIDIIIFLKTMSTSGL